MMVVRPKHVPIKYIVVQWPTILTLHRRIKTPITWYIRPVLVCARYSIFAHEGLFRLQHKFNQTIKCLTTAKFKSLTFPVRESRLLYNWRSLEGNETRFLATGVRCGFMISAFCCHATLYTYIYIYIYTYNFIEAIIQVIIFMWTIIFGRITWELPESCTFVHNFVTFCYISEELTKTVMPLWIYVRQ
jgi:hypothetical protein